MFFLKKKARYKFYVVDDVADMTELVEAILRAEYGNVEVKTFNDPVDAYNEIIEEKLLPDLIICDQLMPQLNGLELRKTMKENGIDVPFVFITQLGGEDVLSGNTIMLSKPVQRQKLRAVVDRFLNAA